MASMAVVAGSISTVLFAISTLPMLIKAARTKELASYSRGNLVLANVGNAVHSIYVLQLPPGPIWALHGFYVITSGLMLFWHLRYVRRSPRPHDIPSFPGGSHDHRTHRDSDHRRRSGRPSNGLSPAATRSALRDLGHKPVSRRQLASTVGLTAALLTGPLRRATGTALSRAEMDLSDQIAGG
jgi:uncharacterized protein with PQ loop repeat